MPITSSTTFSQESSEPPIENQSIQIEDLQAILNQALNQSGSVVSVHAAESMLSLGQNEIVSEKFQFPRDGEVSGFHVAGLRVVVKLEQSPEKRERLVQEIREILLDPNSKFHVHAMESLAKLNAPILPEESEMVTTMAFSADDSGAPFALWRLAQSDDSQAAFHQLAKLLISDQEVTQFRSAYALWHLQPLPVEVESTVVDAGKQKELSPMTRLMVLLAGGQPGIWKAAEQSDRPAARYFVALELAQRSDPESQQLLEKLANDDDLDVRAAAAFALLSRIQNTHTETQNN